MSSKVSPVTVIGVDEAGRGPLLGRVYAGAVVLGDVDSIDTKLVRDSKKFHTNRALAKAATYVRSTCVASATAFASEKEVDDMNIRRATHRAMHRAIRAVIDQCSLNIENTLLLIDGNDFTPYTEYIDGHIRAFDYRCIVRGDASELSIAAASVLAKFDRDAYIQELCSTNPSLDDKYGLARNKGYGTVSHIAGIQEHGISAHHRRTFGICKRYSDAEFVDPP